MSKKSDPTVKGILRQLEKEKLVPHAQSINWLLAIMARLRAPNGCPWDREQDHHSLRFHAVEEVYELMDAIEANDDHEMEEELGDLLLQVVFHCQLARERGAFDFEAVCRNIAEKLIRRHPHVFGDVRVKDVEAVWANWDKIKRAEKEGTRHARPSALDGIPRHLPALLRAQKLVKKAAKAQLWESALPTRRRQTRAALAEQLFALAAEAQERGWNAEDLLRAEIRRQERRLRQKERRKNEGGAKG
ncbi:MazG family protein [Fontisphaera persica]|uniref:nucleoside triphosphate pyrophosphohydrolase n=1 Tax=Fontisphaera persica TaxID=2974023 RepID=UPI0024C09536|nr:MazG family protein [Fontisphaera persica]WCJ60601.1 MazG family protein [Fontisphaera persica]